MQNPVRLERLYNKFEKSIRRTSSRRRRLLYIYAYLEELEPAEDEYEPYVLQIIQWLPILENYQNLSGMDPELLYRCIKRLDEVANSYPVVKEEINFTDRLYRLKNGLLLGYAWTGELDSIWKFLAEQGLINRDAVRPPYPEDMDISLDQFSKWIQKVSVISSRAFGRLKEVKDVWERIKSFEGHYTAIPVIEERAGDTNFDTQGRLRLLHLRIVDKLTRRYGKDRLWSNIPMHDGSTQFSDFVQPALRAARKVLEIQEPKVVGDYFEGYASFEITNGLHEGRSADLALAALFINTVLHYLDAKRQFRLNPKICITGQLEEDGSVKAVEEHSLPTKVQAAFFSWCKRLIVPHDQLQEARSLIKRLQKKYPRRKLEVFGAEHINDLYYDRRITVLDDAGVIRYWGRKAWRNKFSVAGIVIILSLAAIIGRFIYGPIDKKPAFVDKTGSSLLVKNSSGNILKTINVGKMTLESYGLGDRATNRVQSIPLLDINGDGYKEIFYWQKYQNSNKDYGYVYCYDVRRSNIVWGLKLKFNIKYPFRSDIAHDRYYAQNMEIVPPDKDYPPYLIVSSILESYFPNLLLKINARTGEIVSRYVHPGYIYDTELVDITGDGYPELVGGAVHNGYDYASLFALSIEDFGGQAPTNKLYWAEGFKRANELCYLAIPLTLIGKSLKNVSDHNEIKKVRLNRGSKILTTYILDVDRVFTNQYKIKSAYYLGYFNFNLRPVGFGTSNGYDQLAENLWAEGKLKQYPDQQYFQSFKDSLWYYDGHGGWQHEPVFNPYKNMPDSLLEKNKLPIPGPVPREGPYGKEDDGRLSATQ